MATSSPSNALIKRSSDVDLMPPPPSPKRIKRPPKVLDEDDYTDALSHIIARDFFPGLLETQIQQDYLDAVESKDKEWIAAAGRRLSAAMTPGRQPSGGRRGVSFTSLSGSATPKLTPRPVSGETPRQWVGDTPMSVASTVSTTETTVSESTTMKVDAEKMSLGAFQTKYTSEDNESFNALLDRQNTKRREKYAWMWSGNKVPSARQIAHRQRETKRLEGQKGSESGSKELIKTDMDARPARPDAWKSKPENSLMFTPSSVEDTHETVQQKAEATSRMGPKRVLYHNTRIQHTLSDGNQNEPPPSPSISAIRDAIAGRPRLESESGFTGGETPRVNGYTFVDEDEPEPEPTLRTEQTSEDEAEYHLRLLTSTASSTPNPFKLQETRRREALHHRMVERVAKTKRTEKIASTAKTPVPRFPSSPMVGLGGQTPGKGAGLSKAALTPAGQRLWASVGNSTPRRTELSGGGTSGLKNMWTPTPKRGR